MKNQRGFTLIEIIVTLVLVGIMATVAGMGIVTFMRGYLFAKDNSANSQKANLALSRLNREFQELITIPGNMNSNATGTALMYQRLSNGVITTFSVGLDGSNLKIKTGATAIADYTTGDTLIDNVAPSTGFALNYYEGNDAWGKTDIQKLSTIRINLTLNQPSAGTPISFTTTVNPRNNNNTGGASPTGASGGAPSAGCFIATAAFGNDNDPMVILLRNFRDRILMKSAAGRSFVNIYYQMSPSIAETIKENPLAKTITRILLLPLIGVAFTLLYCPALTLPLLFIICFVGARWMTDGWKRQPLLPISKRLAVKKRGSVMIGLIITMVIMASLGAAMTALLPSASMSQIGSSFAQKAYFLAESGLRYAASEYHAAADPDKENILKNEIDNHSFILDDDDGRFHLRVYPFYYRTTAAYAAGANQITTEVPGTIPSELDARYSSSTSGRLKIGNLFYRYNGTSHVGGSRNVTFNLTTNLTAAAPINQLITTAALRSGSGNLTSAITLESTASSAFPLLNGTFKIAGLTGTNATRTWIYTRRNGNVLEGVKALDDPTVNLNGIAINNTTNYIILEKFVKVMSTGIYAYGTFMEAKREILYNIPIGQLATGITAGKKAKEESFSGDPSVALANFATGSGEAVGTFTTAGGALDVTGAERWYGTFGGRQWWSIIAYDWTSANIDLAQAWWSAGRTLSTDLQVKVRVQNQPIFFMAGIGFKLKTYGSGEDSDYDAYGVSFVRAMQESGGSNECGWIDCDAIPDELVPANLFTGSMYTSGGNRYSQPAIVLWKRTGNQSNNPASGNFQWLAYKILTTDDHVVQNTGSNNLNLKDWSNIQVRAIEAYPLEFRNGGPTAFRYGDIIAVMRSGVKLTAFRINGSPILTNANWSTHQAQGTLLLSNVDTTINFQNTDELHVNGVKRGEVNMSGALSGQKKNYIKVYYADTDTWSPLSSDTAPDRATDNYRSANTRLLTGETVYWPVDDISSWVQATDYMTLVEWDGWQGGVTIRSSVGEGSNIIVQDSSFLTPPPPDTTVLDHAGIFLFTAGGDDISSYNPPVQFDDFAIQWEGEYGSGGGSGFLPTIQQ